MKWYNGKKVFITGGSSGIGKAAATLLARAGADVFIAARGQKRLDAALAEVSAAGARPDQAFGAVALDIADRTAVEAAAAQVLDTLGGLDVLINNAGIAHPSRIEDTPDAIYEEMMRVNYFGTVNVTRAFLPHFKSQGGGRICNVTSVLGFMGIYGYTAYAASKFATTGFTECLRQELLEHRVKVSMLCPPDTDTPQLHEENKIKPPETKEIAGTIKPLPAEAVAHTMLKGIIKGKYWILPGFMTKLTFWMHRRIPFVVRMAIDGPLRKYQRKQRREAAQA